MTTASPLPPPLAALADALREAEAARVAIATPSDALDLDVAAAYAVQRHNIARRTAAGERVVGHKIGLTSLAMQRQLGVDQPDFGAITDRMVVADGGTVEVGELLAPKLEPEFAFRLGAPLAPSPSMAQLRDAIDGVAVAIEVIDSRIADWRITLADTIADNASSARIVAGEFAPASRELLDALPHVEIELDRDGEVVAAGPGSAVLGDPLVALHWLASELGRFGEAFAAGDIVLAGAVTAAAPLDAGCRYEARAAGLAPVSLTAS